ncbi:leucyl aminopeptidase, partial [Streptomonospora algeriensis]
LRSRGTGQTRIALALPADTPELVQSAALGALLGDYSFTRYRTGEDTRTPAAELRIVSTAAGAHEAAERANTLAGAVSLSRDLVNTSPADLVPEDLANVAAEVARENGLGIEILDESQLTEGGYGGLVGVGQGSGNPPRLVRLEYSHPEASRTIAFVGKGITFDSGGLSLKPAASMDWMKSDMGGAAAVLGAMRAIAQLRPTVNAVAYLAVAENMPGGNAQRPSDVLTIYGGKTVEVLNTDAEGRLVMADALVRAHEDSPELIVDVATLTGAQLVALGTRVFGVMANDDSVREDIVAAATAAGEQAWPMPLPEELRQGLDSSVADIANVAGERWGGMLSAGIFLKEFVAEDTRWAHLDIAGPAFNQGGPFGYTPKGGTGAATRTLVRIAENHAARAD